MILSVICFTRNGYDRMKELNQAGIKDMEIRMFCKCSQLKEACADIYIEESIADWTEKQFAAKNAILFIGATGIAVRAIAPFAENKLTDSPVLVMDDRGRYIIPLLSGHVGGANEIAVLIAEKMGVVPVITTATDINGKFAVDVFAKKNNLAIVNKAGIAAVSSKALTDEKLTICIGKDVSFDDDIRTAFEKAHADDLILLSEEGADPSLEYDVFIGKKTESSPHALLELMPQKYVLGIGCRMGKPKEDIAHLAFLLLSELEIAPEEVCAVTSVVHKRTEKGLIDFARELNVPFITYTAEELESLEGDFSVSEFVKQTTGTGCVSERAAVYYCEGEGELILRKVAENGVTLAIAEKKWRLEFYE